MGACSVTQLCMTLRNSRDCGPPVSSDLGISQQEYASVLPFPTSRELPHPGSKSTYLALPGSVITTEPPGKPIYTYIYITLTYFP